VEGDTTPTTVVLGGSDALDEARKLEPPVATSTQSGDSEGSEWWLEHESLLQSAWNQWDDDPTRGGGGDIILPPLDASLIHFDLRRIMDRTKNAPTPEHEASIHRAWDEVLFSSTTTTTRASSTNVTANTKSKPNSNPRGDSASHRVYRYPEFLTVEGIRRFRSHLDALSQSGIPMRRPNAMNRNGLLLVPSVPGGVFGDPAVHEFVELLAGDYLRPLGRSFFPEFAGDPSDDSEHYAFTIRYGTEDNRTRAATTTTTSSSSTDWDLKEHSDASLYTLNINLNLPEENYSGSSLYFVAPETNDDRNGTNRAPLCEINFEPGTALLHRGMTKHGALPLEGGKRNNLVIWLHGTDGYVRIAPYKNGETLSLEERWSSSSSSATTTTTPTPKSSVVFGSSFQKDFDTEKPSTESVEL